MFVGWIADALAYAATESKFKDKLYLGLKNKLE